MKQNVLGFDIPVNNILIMHELNCMANLLHHFSHLLFSKTAILPQRCIDISTAAWLKDQVKMVLVTEESVELDYVGMIQKTLDFYLSNQLVYESRLAFKYLLGDFLQCADKIYFFVTG